MNLEMIKWLKEHFGDRYVSADALFRKSLNEVAVPAMGHKKATLWIIVDNCRGEDIARRHYETMLQCDKELTGEEQLIDPYGGPREMTNRLRAQGFDIKMTAYPKGFDKMVDHAKLYAAKFAMEQLDVQMVCYNLEDRVMPTEEMEKQA
uniref:Uncharacterized protein n=1 Tax=Pseudomonas phage RVTF4 TaxID=3236931 RepID=A0AB39CCK5_9VIRU